MVLIVAVLAPKPTKGVENSPGRRCDMETNGMIFADVHPLIRDARLLIFDCDGVLFNSSESNVAFFNHCLELAGHGPLGPDLVAKATFMSVGQLLEELFSVRGERERVFEISQSVRFELFFDAMQPLFDFDFVLPILERRYHLAVASNRSASLEKVFTHFRLGRYFSFSVSALDAPPKPAPEMLLRCCRRFDVPPARAVFLGDSKADLAAALNAGTGFIGIGDHLPEPRVSSPAELITA
jgi:HAD superfamily hydrolase (TIGR01549 family)